MIRNFFRKIVAVLVIMSLFLPTMNGQTKKNEISLEYSQLTIPQGIYVFGGIFGVIFTLGNFTFDNTRMTGALGVGYTRNVNDWFSYGGIATGEYITSDTLTKDSDGNMVKNGTYDMGVATVMPVAKFTWLRKDWFGMYSKVGVGAGVVLSSDAQVIPVAQLSPICASFEGQKIKGVLELGAGMQGCVTVGVVKTF